MNQEEFNKLLKDSGLPEELSQKMDELTTALKECESVISSLEARVAVINSKINPEQQKG